MQRAIRRGVLVAFVGSSVLLLLAGCGRNVGSVGSAGSPQPSTSSSATPNASNQLASGHVTLTVDKQRYATNDTIAVTIHNGLPQTIWAADHQTSCTTVTAERLQDGKWETVGVCRLMTPTRLVPLSAASAVVQHLVGTGSSSGRGWPSGTYRVTLTYTGGDEGTSGPSGVVHSDEFTIG
jgi:hypothetical protein